MKKLIILIMLLLCSTSYAELWGTGSASTLIVQDAGDEDATYYVGFWRAVDGALVGRTDTGITYNPNTNTFTVTGLGTFGEIIITEPSAQNYKIGAAVTGAFLGIMGTESGQSSRVALTSFDGDGTKQVRLDIYGVGSNEVGYTNTESLSIGFVQAAIDFFTIQVFASGSGELRDLIIAADGSVTQLVLQADGDITIANNLDVGNDLTVGNDLDVSGAAHLGSDGASNVHIINNQYSLPQVIGPADYLVKQSGAFAWDYVNPGTLDVATADAVAVTNEAADTETFFGFYTAASGDLPGKTNAALKFNASTDAVTFTGDFTVGSTAFNVDATNNTVGIGAMAVADVLLLSNPTITNVTDSQFGIKFLPTYEVGAADLDFTSFSFSQTIKTEGNDVGDVVGAHLQLTITEETDTSVTIDSVVALDSMMTFVTQGRNSIISVPEVRYINLHDPILPGASDITALIAFFTEEMTVGDTNWQTYSEGGDNHFGSGTHEFIGITQLGNPVKEVQTCTPNAQATGGTFKITYNGQETAAGIAYDATTAEIKTALETLSTVNVDDITVFGKTFDSSDFADGLVFTFLSILGDVTAVSFDVSSLTSVASVGVVETVAGDNDFTQIGPTGVLTLAGAARVFRHVVIGVESATVGATAPTLAFIGNFAVDQFSQTLPIESIFMTWHIPPDWAVGTDIDIHVHWAPVNGNAGDVVWDIDYSAVASEVDDIISGAGTALTVTDSTQSLQDELLETADMVISGAGIALEDTIGLKISRDTNDIADDYGASASLVLIEILYLADKLGEEI